MYYIHCCIFFEADQIKATPGMVVGECDLCVLLHILALEHLCLIYVHQVSIELSGFHYFSVKVSEN